MPGAARVHGIARPEDFEPHAKRGTEESNLACKSPVASAG